jgi:hypothetical protein
MIIEQMLLVDVVNELYGGATAALTGVKCQLIAELTA